jgi:hypothetical protein
MVDKSYIQVLNITKFLNCVFVPYNVVSDVITINIVIQIVSR